MLEVKNLQVFYGEIQALWDISFQVEEGEIVTLLGANGAGKSTTLKAISGMLPAKGGEIRFEGAVLKGLSCHHVVERGIVQIPEGRQLWPGMTVLENLQLGAYLPATRRNMQANLERVFTLFPRLKERLPQKAGTLSGGEQQMCAIGRGLMSQPRLLMLDEPSLGLAPRLVADVFRVLGEIREQGVTILLVEQNINHALRAADRAYVLETGRVALEGSGQELLNDTHVQQAYMGVARA